MSRPYPSKPPFPHHGVSSIEGLRLESGSRHARTLPRTHLFGAVEGTLRSLGAYLDGYEPRAGKEGRIVVVQGDHGSGKTHTLHYATGRLAQARREAAGDGGVRSEVQQMYAKADDQRFVAVFRALMGYMDVTYMSELNSAFLKSITSEAADLESGSAGLLEQLKRDPELINYLFDSGVVEEGEVHSEQAKEMGRVKRRKEFQNAFYYGSSVPELQAPAFEWFCGRPISEEHRRRLGVEGPLESSEDAKSALGLLARLFNHASVPLILYLDQYEKLVLRQDGSPHVENVGVLRSLVEIVAREQGALVLAGIPAAWEALTPDVRERVGNDHFELTILTLDEARDIVALYLTPPGQVRRPGSDDAGLYPFEPDAIRAMMRLGGGNLRRLLQLSSGVFEAAQTSESSITAELVEEIARIRNLKFFDRETVVADLEQILSQRSLSFERNPASVPLKTDFMVSLIDGSARLLIKVKHALFHDDEAVSALESLNYIAAARQLEPPARVALVVAGYVSPEVTERLRRVVNELVVYQPDSFAVRLGPILDELDEAGGVMPATADATVVDEQLTRELGEIRLELQSLAKARGNEAELLEERLAKLLEEQGATREAQRRAETWSAWAQKRDGIRQKIQDARREREERDLEEMEEIRRNIERKLWRSRLIQAGAVLALAIVLGFVSSAVPNGGWVKSVVGGYGPPGGVLFKSLFFEIGLFGGLLLAAVFLASRWLPDQRFSELAHAFRSREELRRAARSHGWLPQLHIWHWIPQVRYAAAVSNSKEITDRDIRESLGRETSALVRDLLAREAGRRQSEAEEFPPVLEPGTRDAAHFLESWIGHGGSELPPFWQRSDTMVTLAAVCGGFDVDDRPSLASSLALERRGRAGLSPLGRAFERGLSPDSVANLTSITQTQCERAIEELSPFDEGGLGTFDNLESMREIDAYYLFFRQLFFVMERGALTPESN